MDKNFVPRELVFACQITSDADLPLLTQKINDQMSGNHSPISQDNLQKVSHYPANIEVERWHITKDHPAYFVKEVLSAGQGRYIYEG